MSAPDGCVRGTAGRRERPASHEERQQRAEDRRQDRLRLRRRRRARCVGAAVVGAAVVGAGFVVVGGRGGRGRGGRRRLGRWAARWSGPRWSAPAWWWWGRLRGRRVRLGASAGSSWWSGGEVARAGPGLAVTTDGEVPGETVGAARRPKRLEGARPTPGGGDGRTAVAAVPVGAVGEVGRLALHHDGGLRQGAGRRRARRGAVRPGGRGAEPALDRGVRGRLRGVHEDDGRPDGQEREERDDNDSSFGHWVPLPERCWRLPRLPRSSARARGAVGRCR